VHVLTTARSEATEISPAPEGDEPALDHGPPLRPLLSPRASFQRIREKTVHGGHETCGCSVAFRRPPMFGRPEKPRRSSARKRDVCRRTLPIKVCSGLIKTTGILGTNLDGDRVGFFFVCCSNVAGTLAGSVPTEHAWRQAAVWFLLTSPLRLNWQPGRERPPGTDPGPGIGIEVGVAHVPAAVLTGIAGRRRPPPAYATASSDVVCKRFKSERL